MLSWLPFSDLPLHQNEVEEEGNQFSGGMSFKKKEDAKTLDHIKTNFHVATEV